MITDQLTFYIGLLAIIVVVSVVFNKSSIPVPLILVLVGMVISFLPNFPHVRINSELVLNIFLPLLLYQAGAYASWRDFKRNMRAILLLSVGHVLFITVLVAVCMYFLIPQLSWPLAFVLGAVVSPPDDVAFLSIAEKIHVPQRIFTILVGEGLLNDATALTLFRFALLAVVSHQFSAVSAVSTFVLVVLGETLYGLALGYITGQIRLRIKDSTVQMMLSFITPFLAFLVPEKLGGSGVIATVVTGIVIGTHYLERFPPEVRLTANSIWTMISFTLQNVLFLLIGLELRFIVERISSIPMLNLIAYSLGVVAVIIIGRFLWVYPATYIPRYLFPSIRKREAQPPWQFPFVVSWAGMRGGISLAAALAVPMLPSTIDGVNPRDLIVFLVFCVITATLVLQGLSLPWLLRKLKVHRHGQKEKYEDHLSELRARISIKKYVCRWLANYEDEIKDDVKLSAEVKLRRKEYQAAIKHLQERIDKHGDISEHDPEAEAKSILFLSLKLIALEREEISRQWSKNRISYVVKTKLILQLDHREKHITAYI